MPANQGRWVQFDIAERGRWGRSGGSDSTIRFSPWSWEDATSPTSGGITNNNFRQFDDRVLAVCRWAVITDTAGWILSEIFLADHGEDSSSIPHQSEPYLRIHPAKLLVFRTFRSVLAETTFRFVLLYSFVFALSFLFSGLSVAVDTVFANCPLHWPSFEKKEKILVMRRNLKSVCSTNISISKFTILCISTCENYHRAKLLSRV